ncbi:MAG: hypothetical protein DRI90_28870 [Deltaproteobacteria bacterium]|nr:MAG: hypothetical protein DRI90_28870 [Deltaproteobacteria bacterium]
MTAPSTLRFSVTLLIAALATVGAGCDGNSGYEDCVSSCEAQLDCAGAPEQTDICAESCELQEERADDHDCEGEWEDAQACMRDAENCDWSECQDEMMDFSNCEMSYCSDNPNDPDCGMDSAS